jgi:alkylhydroperoxidase/carboxymuconolactone decarboxylase family protein YurZ
MDNQPNETTFDSRHARGLSARDVDEAAYEDLVERFGPTGAWIVDHVEGELWSRPGLSRRDRAMAAFAVVAAQGGQGSVQSAGLLCLDAGVTTTELDEVLGHVTAYAGLARPMRTISWPVLRTCNGHRIAGHRRQTTGNA